MVFFGYMLEHPGHFMAGKDSTCIGTDFIVLNRITP
jgi:hypothetical protein